MLDAHIACTDAFLHVCCSYSKLRRHINLSRFPASMPSENSSAPDLTERLNNFEPVSRDESAKPPDTAFADQFLKVFRRMAKTQFRTQQKADLSARKVEEHLSARSDLLDNLKSDRAKLEDKNEQLQRFILEVVDLITGFEKTAQNTNNPEMQSAAATMTKALEQNMKKIGMQEIPAVGQEPDGIYHFVLNTTEAEKAEDADRIVEVVQPGYTLHGEVVRKANVIVAK